MGKSMMTFAELLGTEEGRLASRYLILRMTSMTKYL